MFVGVWVCLPKLPKTIISWFTLPNQGIDQIWVKMNFPLFEKNCFKRILTAVYVENYRDMKFHPKIWTLSRENAKKTFIDINCLYKKKLRYFEKNRLWLFCQILCAKAKKSLEPNSRTQIIEGLTLVKPCKYKCKKKQKKLA